MEEVNCPTIGWRFVEGVCRYQTLFHSELVVYEAAVFIWNSKSTEKLQPLVGEIRRLRSWTSRTYGSSEDRIFIQEGHCTVS